MSKRVDLLIATVLTGLVLTGGIVLAIPDAQPSGWGGAGAVQSISISLGAGQSETGEAQTDAESAEAVDSTAAEVPEEIVEPDPEQETEPEPVPEEVVEPEPEPEPEPEVIPEPEPEPEIVEEQPEPIPEPEPVVKEVVEPEPEPEPVVEQELAEVLPVRMKPKPPVEQPEAPKLPEPVEQAAQPTPQPSGLTNSVKSEGTVGETSESQSASSSKGSGGGAASQAMMVDYQSSVLETLARFREYPERAMRRRIEGENRIRLVIARDGTVLEATMVTSSGSSILDRETERLIERVRKFPPFPDEMTEQQVTWTVPVAYQLH
ncbi:energy transducer TonB [Thalassospira sp. HJ]|uniref:energy transducer TonB n=1 Tax=Thalassospira sp. HJ TaxID=1616823 RepID=UPI0005CEBC72|nr:energy transducer TonB [Thalassospira sp. HJ]KJE37195.1 energy transducer TonB [Thalassospira sp. HJ]